MEPKFSTFPGSEAGNDPCYFFPSVDESDQSTAPAPSGPDDWSTVTDRRAKKKIQNRIAQRNYRSRVKQRLEYLQRQVDSLGTEGQPPDGESRRSGPKDAAASAAVAKVSNPSDDQEPSPARASGISKTKSTLEQPSLRRQPSNQACDDQQQQPSSLEGAAIRQSPVDWSMAQLPRYLLPPAQQTQFPGFNPFAQDPLNPAYQNASLSPKAMEEGFLLSQSAPMNGFPMVNPMYMPYQDLFNQTRVAASMTLGEMQSELSSRQIRRSDSQETLYLPPTPLRTTRSAQNRRASDSPPSPMDLDTNRVSTTTDTAAVQQQRQSKPQPQPQPQTKPQLEAPESLETLSDLLQAEVEAAAEDNDDDDDDNDDEDDAIARPNKDAALHRRLDYILDCAKHVGFDSFDALASTYYTGAFENTSGVSSEQRLSRMRRLPGFLAAIHDSSARWTQWERQGYQDEVLKAAEEILGAECGRVRRNGRLKGELLRREQEERRRRGSEVVPSDELGEGRAVLGFDASMTKMLQDELPNLWALVTALASDNTAVRQRDRSHIVFTTLLVMCCAGHVPTSQLGVWINDHFDGHPGKS